MPAKLNRPAPFLIGVAGGTASGKSTVCEKIMEKLRLNQENVEIKYKPDESISWPETGSSECMRYDSGSYFPVICDQTVTYEYICDERTNGYIKPGTENSDIYLTKQKNLNCLKHEEILIDLKQTDS